MKFSIKDLFSKSDQIRSFQRFLLSYQTESGWIIQVSQRVGALVTNISESEKHSA